MTEFARIAFWLSAAALLYAYVGFPLLVAVVGLLRRTGGVDRAPVTPRLTVVIAAYNEEAAIGERLENVLASDYPADSLEVILACDGCSDQTERIAAGFAHRGVRALCLPRQGKIPALDAAVREATGEVLVFSDANTLFEPDTLRTLAANFADPAVGGVAGHTGYRLDPAGESSARGERLYWRYDTWLKELESRTGSVVSAHGGLYAIRRELYRTPEDPAVTDDFAISTAVVEQGRRLVFEPRARAWEVAVPEARNEFRRRVRLMTRGLRAVAHRRRLLNPFRYGFYALVLFSHKVLRRLVPVALLALLAASVHLAPAGPFYRIAAGGQLAFYALAGAGYLTRRTRVGRWKPFYVPFYFVLANAAALVALVNFARGARISLWEPQRHAAGAG